MATKRDECSNPECPVGCPESHANWDASLPAGKPNGPDAATPSPDAGLRAILENLRDHWSANRGMDRAGFCRAAAELDMVLAAASASAPAADAHRCTCCVENADAHRMLDNEGVECGLTSKEPRTIPYRLGLLLETIEASAERPAGTPRKLEADGHSNYHCTYCDGNHSESDCPNRCVPANAAQPPAPKVEGEYANDCLVPVLRSVVALNSKLCRKLFIGIDGTKCSCDDDLNHKGGHSRRIRITEAATPGETPPAFDALNEANKHFEHFACTEERSCTSCQRLAGTLRRTYAAGLAAQHGLRVGEK